MRRRLTILGCGSSAGVPRVAGGWGVCDPSNPKNRRGRCSVLIEQFAAGGVTRVLVDTSPDLREQLIAADIAHLDAVVFTHAHADHTHGIDDVRPIVQESGVLLDAWMDEPTSEVVRPAFRYMFERLEGSVYPELLRERRMTPGVDVVIDGAGGPVALTPFRVDHGEMPTLGFRFGATAYTPDLIRVPAESLSALEGLDLWVIDALRYRPHLTHFSVDDALEWIARMRPRRAVLTNLSSEIDYDTLCRETPGDIDPAWDGMGIDIF
jgi:phosphoribosyl 1,2-cyclic phosphate phosphodiesterase